jgi:hypothetical protein
MRCRFLLVLLTLVVALLAGATSGGVKVCFSPQGGCDQALIRVARTAEMYPYTACYTFSLDTIAYELIAAVEHETWLRELVDRLTLRIAEAW